MDSTLRRRFIRVNPAEDDGPETACVLFAVLPPKNGNSTGAKAQSAPHHSSSLLFLGVMGMGGGLGEDGIPLF
jgi:hypothetical protein